jgi:HlyD family secretion protein
MQRMLFIPCVIFLMISCRHTVVIHPERKSIVETVYASGKIIADSEYNVYSLNNGNVVKKLVKEGDIVTRGQTLYIIDYSAAIAKLDAAQSAYSNFQNNVSGQSPVLNDLKLSLQNAESKFANDSLQYFRLKNLWEQNIGTKNALDNAYTTYQLSVNEKRSAEEKYNSTLNDLQVSLHNAKSQVINAQTDLKNYFIKSDDSGTVYQTYKEAGEAVRANDILALMGKSSQRIIKLAVDQQDIDKIKLGQEVLLKTDLTGDSVYHATISRIYPVMNESDQTFRVDAVFTPDIKQQYIHSSVEANIIITKKDNALIIPRGVLLPGDSVQVKQNGKAQTVAVKTGILSLDEAEILSGVDSSSEIIVPSQQ